MMPNLSPHRLTDKLFRIRKFQYSTYEIDHPQVKGTLRIANIPTNILEVPEEMLPPQARGTGIPTYMVGGQAIVAFTNRGTKKEPSLHALTPELMQTARKVELTNYVTDQSSEPWNEILVSGNPPILVRMRTILAKVDWFPDHTNQLGDPSIWAYHNTTQSVSIADSGEAGLT